MDIIGKKFGRLTVIDYDGKDGKHIMVKCKCECGNYTRTRVNRLITGTTKSCGCYRKDKQFKHGQTHSKLYNRWCNMRRRCYEPNNRYFKDYGGRGIFVCDEWKNSFETFYQWAIDNGYQEALTLDRIDNNGSYEPNNCRWVAAKVQANNRRSSKYIEYHGQTMTVAEWGNFTNINPSKIRDRLKDGWPIGEALEFEPHTPNRKKRS